MNWIEAAEHIAQTHHDGHLTILRFTTGWKAVYGTPDTWGTDRSAILAIPTSPTMDEACRQLVTTPVRTPTPLPD